MGNIMFSEEAFEDYLYWQTQDRRTLRRINLLLKELCRNPFEGLGKPEPLRQNHSGLWSRRIDEVNRLVYCVLDKHVVIYQCKGHYDG